MATLSFKGKTFVQNHHLSVKYHQLVPKKEKSLTDKISLNDNLIIHGDNLIALKAFLPTYAGKVKCIYIDPPYNTGNEKWIYDDNVNSPMMQEWLGKVVDREDFTRHDKWLCMMMPRLKLLRELLREDGVIFVSIDDNEVHHLRMLMDEIFGEESFIAQYIWKSRQNIDNRNVTGTSIDHEYVLCYGTKVRGSERKTERYSNPDNDSRGHWVSSNMVGLLPAKLRPNCHYDLVNPETGINYGKPKLGWRYDKNTMKRLIEEDRIIWPQSHTGRPRRKVFLNELQQKFTGYSSIIGTNIYTRDGTMEIEEVFGKRVLDFPKPSMLIRELIIQGCEENDIILDSFAGSGTTAHAVLALNNEDGGNRKFILVECEEYADKITAERVRKVIKGVKTAKDEKLKKGLGGTFSYFELGEPIEMESILEGKKLPDYMELARYIFYTATGEEFNPSKVKQSKNFIGETKDYEVYLFYEPDIEKLKKMALTLDTAKKLGSFTGKKRLVFAPAKYLDLNDTELIERHGLKGIEYCQLPFEIYKMRG
ncbi:MAG: site-specific DNA-methyltransferase [Thermodesulfovibrionales bacterium]|nr:site-specific DNA-methyltransferase [Thermodesulfovibrionales bacterium]